MIHIDRVNADVQVLRSPASDGPMDPAPASAPAGADGISMERLHRMVMEVLREHLRDLERRGLL